MDLEIDEDLLNLLFDETIMEQNELMFDEVNFDLKCEMLQDGEEQSLELTEPSLDLHAVPLAPAGPKVEKAVQLQPQEERTRESERFKNEPVNIDQFLKENQNVNTQKKTKQDVELLQQFLERKGETRMIQFIPPNELSEFISEFLLSVKKKNGEEYEPCSLRSFVSSFDRHLKSCSYICSVMNSLEFGKCREVLRVKQKQLKGIGKGNKPHAADPMDDGIIEKLYDCGTLGDQNPQALLHSLWTICTQHFGMRTGQEVHDMKWGDIQMKAGPEGQYLVYDTERHTKTRQGSNCRDTRMFKPRAYEVPDIPERDPIHLYNLYRSKRPVDMLGPDTPFFLGINSKNPSAHEPWYRRQPLGINKIYGIMKEMIKHTGIESDRKLTPYSMRKQLLQKLNDNGVPAHQIVQISGHKNVNSINNYSKLNPNQSKEISNILSNSNLPPTYSGSTAPAATALCPVQQHSLPVVRSPLAPIPPSMFSGNVFHGSVTINMDNTKSLTQTQTLETANCDSPRPRKKWKRIRTISSDSD